MRSSELSSGLLYFVSLPLVNHLARILPAMTCHYAPNTAVDEHAEGRGQAALSRQWLCTAGPTAAADECRTASDRAVWRSLST